MAKRIWLLLLLQLYNKFKRKEKGSLRIYRVIAVQAVILVLVSIVASFAIYAIKNIFYIPVNEYFAIFIFVLTQGISILSSLVHITNDLYHSRDNQILFPLPVKNDEIFISKFILYYIQEFLRNLYVLVPILIALGFNQNAHVLYYLNILPIALLLPLLSVFISTLLSIPFVYIKNYLREHQLMSALLTLVVLVTLGYFIYILIQGIPIPIRLVQLYNSFIIGLTLFMQQIADFGFVYTYIGFILYNVNPFIHYVYVLGITILLGLSNYLIAKPMYFRLTSRSNEHSVKKNKSHKTKESKSLFMTFFRKEMIIARRSPNELINNYALLISLPMIMYILNYIYMGMNRSTFGNSLVLILNILICLLVVTGSNTQSASAITKEGYEFILLKTAPYDTSKIAWAKLLFNLLITLFVIGISFIVFSYALPVFPKMDIVYLAIFVSVVNIGHIFYSLELDVLNPNLSEYAQTGSLVNHPNIQKSLSFGLILSLLFTLVAVISFIIIEDLGWGLMIGSAIVFALYRFVSFRAYLKAYFIEIEY